LDSELSRLKALFGQGNALKVLWMPHAKMHLSGELVEDQIYIYDEMLQEALRTLRHEYVDYLLTNEIVNPLVDLISLLIKAKEREVYNSKEKLTERLSKLLWRDRN
jgi:phytoene/squalene synthetase